MLSLPAIASQAIDPFAQLMETVYIGKIGKIQFSYAEFLPFDLGSVFVVVF